MPTTRTALTRRSFLAGAAAAATLPWFERVSRASDSHSPEDALAHAVGYLWKQQKPDGSWRSPTYGVMHSGQSMTPFVLAAILKAPVKFKLAGDVPGVEPARDFIRRLIDQKGSLGHVDPDVTEYPVYSTAYAVQCLVESSDSDDRKLVGRMAEFLTGAQYQPDNGFQETDVAYGGWGFDAPPKPGKTGHIDLAHTRRALDALRLTERWSQLAATRTRAESFLRLLQKQPDAVAKQPAVDEEGTPSADPPPFDGGFYFTPVVIAANKGRVEKSPGPCWRSYATATCEGILALLAAGVPRSDPRVAAAVRWLDEHTNVDYPQGVPKDQPEPWGESIRYYHYMVRAEAYRALDWDRAERAKLAAAIIRQQRPDGSFQNPAAPLMKEDDPLLCTALATIAINSCLGETADGRR